MFLYMPYEENIYTNETGKYTTYGIKVFDYLGTELCLVSDVSTDKTFVSELCRKCTDGQLAPFQLYDVIEDSI